MERNLECSPSKSKPFYSYFDLNISISRAKIVYSSQYHCTASQNDEKKTHNRSQFFSVQNCNTVILIVLQCFRDTSFASWIVSFILNWPNISDINFISIEACKIPSLSNQVLSVRTTTLFFSRVVPLDAFLCEHRRIIQFVTNRLNIHITSKTSQMICSFNYFFVIFNLILLFFFCDSDFASTWHSICSDNNLWLYNTHPSQWNVEWFRMLAFKLLFPLFCAEYFVAMRRPTSLNKLIFY